MKHIGLTSGMPRSPATAKMTKALSPNPLEKGRPLTVVTVVVTVSTIWARPRTLPTRRAIGLSRRRAHSSDGVFGEFSDVSDGPTGAEEASWEPPITSIATLCGGGREGKGRI